MPMLSPLFTLLLVAAASQPAAAPAPATPDPVIALRRTAVADPAGTIERGRALLDHGALAPETEREVLRWIGKAALMSNNEAALTESALRLDSLAETQHDVLAGAYAGFLRGEGLGARGQGEAGLKEALQAAQKLQDRREPELRALVAYQLCDATSAAEQYERAHAYCNEAEDLYRALSDEYNLARSENIHSYVFFNQDRVAEAVRLSERARQRFLTIGEQESAAVIGDNLARLYIEQGRPAQALELSRAALENERKAGRVSHALLSRANIARAQSALGQKAQALTEIESTLKEARELKLEGLLPDLLDTHSRLAEAAGDLKLALAAARAASTAEDALKQHGNRSDLAELEARYAAREKDLRIGELERSNRLQQLELEAAQAREASRLVGESRQRWIIGGSLALALVLSVAVLFLMMYLRAQRRHGERMHELAHTDPLTGVGNRRAFFKRMEAAIAADAAMPRVLLLIDIDHFKRINDSFGHPFGDAVLRQACDTVAARLDRRGFLARLGGEEFGVLCTGFPPTDALHLAEAIRRDVAALRFDSPAGAVTVSVSIGLSMFDPERFRDGDAWLRQADRALYAAKVRGRNRVVASTVVN
jgi:diguanylate cyclase (GGDEF)-like protein